MWTGPTVCSPDHPRRRRPCMGRGARRAAPIVWDNFPVNDGTMERSLHLGPYRGRDPELTDGVDGVLCNPMLQAHASQVALGDGGRLSLRHPSGTTPTPRGPRPHGRGRRA